MTVKTNHMYLVEYNSHINIYLVPIFFLLGGECDAIIVRAPTNSIEVYPVKMRYFCIQDGLLDQTRKVCKIVPAQNSFSKKKNNIIRIITDI